MTWYIDAGPENDVILTSRIRLARNLDHYPFPHRMNKQQSKMAAEEITQAFYGPDKERKRNYLTVDLDAMSEEDQQALAEKRLTSSDLAQQGQNRRVIISRDESISIMINEEDHIRIQSMQPGLNLEDAYQAAAATALTLEGSLALAYSENYGFLTACPTNTGTGMRASVMAHLPGLMMSGRFKDLAESLSKMSFAVRGQYGEGVMPDGEKVPAYRTSAGVDPQSRTETFVAMKLSMDNWRWAGVPFYLRTGKRLPAQYTEIAIQFKRAPLVMFKDTAVEEIDPDMLVLRIQPNEGIQMSFGAKIPGPSMRVGTVNMDFSYADYFGNEPATGYETLIYDCMNGDATLFKHADTVEKGWEIVQSVMDVWSALPPRDFPNYAAGTWGPQAAGDLLKNDGRLWRRIHTPAVGKPD